MKHKIIFVLALIYLFSISHAQLYKSDAPFAHTYSIVAYDPVTSDMGVAVQSH